MPVRYKFVELTVVTDDELGRVVNQWVGEGWAFDGIRFVTTDASRRPTMAFVSFVREDELPASQAPVDDTSPLVTVTGKRPRARAPQPIELGELDLGDDDGLDLASDFHSE